ncbi:MAG: SH3 domain-containing protein, partial [Lachnospiraceae bacterium]|nr:SH3 domain-containing protein [Lachnospiraceae bacterium]
APPVVQTEPTIAEEEPEATVEEEPEKKGELLGRCKSDGVNVRSGASTDFEVLGMASDGDEYKVKSNSESGWTVIEYKGGTGYIFSEYLDFFYMSGGEYTPVDRNEIPMSE